MAVTFRTETVPPQFDARLREAADAVLRGNWRVTALQSWGGGAWNVQIEGPRSRCRIVFSSLDTVTVPNLVKLLSLLVDPTWSTGDAPISYN